MKSKKFITKFVTSLTILGCLIFSACQGEAKNEDIYYTVSYESAHGTAPAAKEFLAGTVLQAADLPALVADGFIFEGWYISTVKITPELAHKVTADITLEAKWSVVNSGTNQGNDDNQGEDNNGGTQGNDNNQGEGNQGEQNQGEQNQGEQNQGEQNQGEQNQGEQNQGEQNQGEQNQSEQNQSEQNQSEQNQGEQNQGEQNQGEQNQGEQNQGEQNQGEQNQGEQNQGEGNQGEGNQGEGNQGGEGQGQGQGTENQGEGNQGGENQGGENPQEVYYTVTYKSQDGVVRGTKDFLAGSQLTAEDLPEPEIPGYSFNGWYFGDELVTSGFKVEDNITLIVVYLPCYTISYSTARGSAPASKTVVVGTKLSAQDLQPLNVNNYEFVGWYIGNNKITVQSEFAIQGNITLVAKWNYTITYSTEHGTVPETKKVLGGTPLTDDHLPTLTANDYDFAGWFIGNRAATVGTEVSDNITLTARWTRSGFSIDVSADTILTDDEKELAVTAERSGDNFILTATPGYDFYVWTVDSTETDSAYNCYYYDDVNSTMNSFRWGYNNPTISETLKNNTLTFNEKTLPRGVAKDGTYVVYVQAYRVNGNSYETAGLVFAVIKM